MGEGADIRSYLHWCFQDNFEWLLGYGQKFGLFERPLPSLDRIPKGSAHMFREIATANAVTAALAGRYL